MRAGERRHLGRLGLELLNIVLAKIAEAGLVRLLDDLGGKDFSDCDQCDVGAPPAGFSGGSDDAFLHARESIGKQILFYADAAGAYNGFACDLQQVRRPLGRPPRRRSRLSAFSIPAENPPCSSPEKSLSS